MSREYDPKSYADRLDVLFGTFDTPVVSPEAWRVGLTGVRERLVGCMNPMGRESHYNNGSNNALRQAVAEIDEVLAGTSPGMKSVATLPAAPAPTEQQDELPITRSTYGSLEACEAEQARRNAALTEQAAKAIYRLFDGADDHPWIEGGNSTKQDDARRFARAALAARPAPTEAVNGDAIAKSKRILNLVDEYELRPTSGNRTTLRMALMAEFEAVGQASDAQVSKMKWAAIDAHRICYETMLKHPEIAELSDDGALHRAIHAIVGVETPSCSEQAPDAAIDPLPRQAAVRGEDAARLDWLEQRGNDGGLLLHAGNQDTGGHSGLGLINTGRTLRQAVDSARGVKAAKSAPATTVKASQ